MQIFTDKAVREFVAGLAKLEAELLSLRAVADAAYGVVNGTDRDRPISLSTMSLMALFDALDAYDDAWAHDRDRRHRELKGGGQ